MLIREDDKMYRSMLFESSCIEMGNSEKGISNKSYQINYFLLVNEDDKNKMNKMYGARIEMLATIEGVEKSEFCYKAPLTYSETEIRKFLTAIWKGNVTPATFEDIVEDFEFNM